MDDNPYRRPESEDAFVPTKRPVVTALKWVLGIGAVVVLLGALLLPAVRTARPAAYRTQCANNLQQIALALHNYHDAYGALPPAYTTDSEGKPLHSWRTLILPFLEEGQLYESIDLSKPWDDPANEKARNTEVSAYQCPSHSDHGRTTYLAIVTPESCLQWDQPRKFSDVTDGPSKTWLVIEVAEDGAVPWMAPRDADELTVLGIQPDSQLSHPGGVNVVYVDGSVRFISTDVSAADRRAMISIAGGDRASEHAE